MAGPNEMSPETLAILERLKQEGKLTRNSGTNSIKAVSIKLDKFSGVFKSINLELRAQTDILRETLDVDKRTQARIARERELDEVAQKAREDDQRKKDDDDSSKKTEDSSKAVKEEVGSIGSMLSGMMGGFKSFVIKSLLGAVGGIAIFELARGFFDAQTEGGFTKFFEDIDWATMTTNMTSIASSIAAGAQSFINFLEDPLGTILGSLSGPTVGAAVITAAGLGGLLNAADSDNAVAQRRSRLRSFVKLSALGLVLAGTSYAVNQVGEWVDKQKWSDDEIGGYTKGDLAKAGLDVASAAMQGASIGWMFGPQGALVGAVIGATVSLGFKAWEFWKKKKAENEARIAGEIAEVDKMFEDSAAKSRVEYIQNELAKFPRYSTDQVNRFNEITQTEMWKSLTPAQQRAIQGTFYRTGEVTGSDATYDRDRERYLAEQEMYFSAMRQAGWIIDENGRIIGKNQNGPLGRTLMQSEIDSYFTRGSNRYNEFLTAAINAGEIRPEARQDLLKAWQDSYKNSIGSPTGGPTVEDFEKIRAEKADEDALARLQQLRSQLENLPARERAARLYSIMRNTGFNPLTGGLVTYDEMGDPVQLNNIEMKNTDLVNRLLAMQPNLRRTADGQIVYNQGGPTVINQAAPAPNIAVNNIFGGGGGGTWDYMSDAGFGFLH